jgi:hypothetical protein
MIAAQIGSPIHSLLSAIAPLSTVKATRGNT